jgi:hypothetical protein
MWWYGVCLALGCECGQPATCQREQGQFLEQGLEKKYATFPRSGGPLWTTNESRPLNTHKHHLPWTHTHTFSRVLCWPTENRLQAGKTRPVQLVCFFSFFPSPLKHRPTLSTLLNFSVLCTSDVLDNWKMYFIPHCCKTFKFGGGAWVTICCISLDKALHPIQ